MYITNHFRDNRFKPNVLERVRNLKIKKIKSAQYSLLHEGTMFRINICGNTQTDCLGKKYPAMRETSIGLFKK
jgi:hypothetical protein